MSTDISEKSAVSINWVEENRRWSQTDKFVSSYHTTRCHISEERNFDWLWVSENTTQKRIFKQERGGKKQENGENCVLRSHNLYSSPHDHIKQRQMRESAAWMSDDSCTRSILVGKRRISSLRSSGSIWEDNIKVELKEWMERIHSAHNRALGGLL
jgi:hypothetical protein